MSIKLMSAVWDDKRTTGAARLVLLSLADQANDEGVCWPSIATIARRANVHRDSVHRAIIELEEMGFLTRTPRKIGANVNQTNLYVIKIPAEAPAGVGVPCRGGGAYPAGGGSRTLQGGVVVPCRGKSSINHQLNTSINQQGKPAAAAAQPTYIATAQSNERIFQKLTGMFTIPATHREAAGEALFAISDRFKDEQKVLDYLQPYYDEWKRRQYNATNLGWLTDWAVAGAIPTEQAKRPPSKNGPTPVNWSEIDPDLEFIRLNPKIAPAPMLRETLERLKTHSKEKYQQALEILHQKNPEFYNSYV